MAELVDARACWSRIRKNVHVKLLLCEHIYLNILIYFEFPIFSRFNAIYHQITICIE